MDNQDNPILCSDVIFKSVFIHNEDILNKFIYDITGYKFNKISLGMNELPIVRKNEKFKRCDFIVHTDKNIVINIELNKFFSDTILVKNTCYIFSLFSSYTSLGSEYNKDLKILQININYFDRFNKPLLDYKLINDKYGYVYFDGIKIWDLYVNKSKRMYDDELKRKKRYIKWGKLFSCGSVDKMESILCELLNKKEVYIFMETVKRVTRYHHVMDEKEALELDNKIRRSLYAEGEEKGFSNGERIGFSNGFSNGEKIGFSNGFSDGIMSMIKAMIDNHIDIETISKVSNKSIEEIDKMLKIL